MMRARAMPALLIALMAGSLLPQVTRADALAEIDSCIMRLEANIDFGFERIAPRCPELVRALRSSEWALWLPAGWDDADNNLSAQSLAALHILMARERALATATRAPDVARLRPILDALSARNQEEHGWWQQLKNWLREVLARSVSTPRANGLERLLGHLSLSQAVLHIITYTIFGFVLLLAAVIVVNEWRAVGWHARLRGRHPGLVADSTSATRAPSLLDLEGLPLLERPRLLLGLIAARLTATQRLPAAQALTVREIFQAARLSARDKDELTAVALAAERQRFSNEAAPTAIVTQVLQRGCELLQRLNQDEARA